MIYLSVPFSISTGLALLPQFRKKERKAVSKLLLEIKPRIKICKTAFKFFTGASVCGCRGNGSITVMKDNKKDAYYFRHDELLIGSFSFVQVDETKVIEAMKYLIRGEN